jgi:hypothetical protein
MAIPAQRVNYQDSRSASAGIAALDLAQIGGLAVRGLLSMGHSTSPSR